MRILKVVLALELLLGAAWTLPLIAEENIGMGGLMLFAWIQPLQLFFMLVSVGFALRKPEARRLAAITFATPLVLLFLPLLLRQLFGGPLVGGAWQNLWLLLAGPLAAGLGYCVLRPQRAVVWLPSTLLESRALNIALLVLSCLGVACWVALHVFYVIALAPDDDGMLFVFMLLCTQLLGLASLPIALYGWLGLFRPEGQGVRRRGLHLAQLFTSSLVMLATVAMVVFVRSALVPAG